MTITRPTFTIGVSLKMYFGLAETARWSKAVARIAATHDAFASGIVNAFVLPTFPAIASACEAFAGTAVAIGAQNLHWEDSGAWTGEVSGPVLRELGATYVEVGHAERRSAFGEIDDIVAAKTAAALRNGLTPVLCVGEPECVSAAEAAKWCVSEVRSALADASAHGPLGRVVVAYEPRWAIGAAAPAHSEHIREICDALRSTLAAIGAHPGSTVIYGGSARPGLLTQLDGAVDGLFLGRFAHNPVAVGQVLDEALALSRSTLVA